MPPGGAVPSMVGALHWIHLSEKALGCGWARHRNEQHLHATIAVALQRGNGLIASAPARL